MNQDEEQRVDVEASANRLKKLSNGFRLAGIGLLLCAVAGVVSYRGANQNFDAFHIVLTAVGSVGCASLLCGQLLWRAVYGIFPSVFPDHGPDAG
jgi:hypothetical protein